MATNTITVTFTPCSPAPASGYNIQYRPVGGTDYRDAGNFTASPAVIVDINDDAGTSYEGYIRGDCGSGNYGPDIPWTAIGSGSECTPLSFIITNITDNSFDITVTGLEDGDSYDVSVDNGSTFPVIGQTNNPISVTDLSATTEYQVVVRRNCAGGGTALSPEQDVTTIEPAPANGAIHNVVTGFNVQDVILVGYGNCTPYSGFPVFDGGDGTFTMPNEIDGNITIRFDSEPLPSSITIEIIINGSTMESAVHTPTGPVVTSTNSYTLHAGDTIQINVF